VAGAGCNIGGDSLASGSAGFGAGSIGNLDGGFSFGFIGAPHPFHVTANGDAYDAFLVGGGSFVTEPFLVPASAEFAFVPFSTPFSFTGTVQGFSTADHSGAPLFALQWIG